MVMVVSSYVSVVWAGNVQIRRRFTQYLLRLLISRRMRTALQAHLVSDCIASCLSCACGKLNLDAQILSKRPNARSLLLLATDVTARVVELNVNEVMRRPHLAGCSV